MTQDEEQFRALYPEIDTILHHSPLRARFLLLTYLYTEKNKKETIESKAIEENSIKDNE